MRIIKILTLIIFLSILFAPLWFKIFAVRSEELQGKTKTISEIPISYDTLKSGAWQQRIEQWIRKHSGIWGHLVKTDNQLSYSLFGQLSNNYKASVVLGRNDALIEKAYLKSANKIGTPKITRLEELARSIKKLALMLAKRKIGFVLLISPSKPALYPDWIPSALSLPSREKRKSAYDQFMPILLKQQVSFIDGPALFRAKQPSLPFRFFAHTGTHWNRYGACLITNEFISKIEQHLGKSLRQVSCEPWEMRAEPGEADRDLSGIINLWDERRFFKPVPVPADNLIAQGGEYQPKVLFVGSSFLWAVLFFLDKHHIYRERDMFYYFKSNYPWPKGVKRATTPDLVNWEKQVFSKDFVIIEINESRIHRAGYGFIKQALGR